MSVIARTTDVKDTLDLFRAAGLYLKPIARLNVSVQLPQLKKSGAKISNWEVMEKVKEMAKPHSFPVFKVRLEINIGYYDTIAYLKMCYKTHFLLC